MKGMVVVAIFPRSVASPHPPLGSWVAKIGKKARKDAFFQLNYEGRWISPPDEVNSPTSGLEPETSS